MKPGNHIRTTLLLTIILLSGLINFAFAGIPEKPNPPRLVNDFANILTAGELQTLESKLVAFNDSTSVQIAVVIVPSLDGYEKADYAQQLGQKWGVGGSKFNNGFVILIKPKTSSENGEAFIATGYGVEQFVPDATTSYEIVNNEMIPRFKQNDYYGGINAATDVIMSLVKGQFKAEDYGKHKKGSPIGFIIIIIIIIIFLISRNNNNHRNISGSGSGGMLLFPWLMSGGFGGGSSGGSFGGGGGGGFGGFGGGGFGGGGAGGSW